MLRTATLALVHSTADHCAPVSCRSGHTRLTDLDIMKSAVVGQPYMQGCGVGGKMSDSDSALSKISDSYCLT